jgi:hypothetical protein
MNACKRLRLPSPITSITSVVAALLASACVVVPSDDPGGANARVHGVVVVGTSVSSALYTSGELGLTTVPTNGGEEAVLAKDLDVRVHITSPVDLDVVVSGTECTEPEQGKKAISVGVIIDDSGSMEDNDPRSLRKAATISFLKALGTGDKVLLSDYGPGFVDALRDLRCVADARAKSKADTTSPDSTDAADVCSSVKPVFSADKGALIRATEEIVSSGGTPLYESCVEMISLVDSVKDGRRGVLLLSDGLPDSDDKRDACHAAAKAAHIPVFTVGLGPAAEGNEFVDAEAVKVLRELSTDTGGSYASANDANQLDDLFRNMGTALARGSCRTTARIARVSEIAPGDKVKGEVTVGSNRATASFELVAPPAPRD